LAPEPVGRPDGAGVDRIEPSDVGRRVVVRYHLPAEGKATDVLGDLVTWSDDALRIRRPDGQEVEVPRADVVAAKPVPSRPVVRREVRAMEAAAALGWQALETKRLGGWLLRASGGFTGRANSCLPLSDPSIPLADAVDTVERWYDARDLPPAFQVIEPLGAALDSHLDARGWAPAPEDVVVMTAQALKVAAAARSDLPSVAVAAEPDAEWLAGYHYRGGATLPAFARDILVSGETVGFASVDQDGARVAVARGAVTDAPDGRRWLGVTAVEVAPPARRQGLGRHVVAGLAGWAVGHGATDVYLQVSEHNAPALAAYERLGFTEHHRYHYRRLG
jgi:N-acetylglutamate synthase